MYFILIWTESNDFFFLQFLNSIIVITLLLLHGRVKINLQLSASPLLSY